MRRKWRPHSGLSGVAAHWLGEENHKYQAEGEHLFDSIS